MQKEKQKRKIYIFRDGGKAFAFMYMLFLLFFVGVSISYGSEDITAQKILSLINKERMQRGLTPLRMNAKLRVAAENKVRDMVRRKYFSHNDPDGNAPWKWIRNAGYNYAFAGENLAIGFTDSKKQHDAWMKSALHRRNILNAQYRDTGIATTIGTIRGTRELVVVQFFGRRVGDVASFLPESGRSVPERSVRTLSPRVNGAFAERFGVSNDGHIFNMQIRDFFTAVVSKVNAMLDNVDTVLSTALSSRSVLMHYSALALVIIQSIVSFAVVISIFIRARRRAIDLDSTML